MEAEHAQAISAARGAFAEASARRTLARSPNERSLAATAGIMSAAEVSEMSAAGMPPPAQPGTAEPTLEVGVW